MGNSLVSVCTDLTVVIQTLHPEGVTLTRDIVQHTPHHNSYLVLYECNFCHIGLHDTRVCILQS